MEFYSVHENVCLWGQSQKKTSPVGAGPEDRSASTAKTQGPIWTVVHCGEKTPGGSRPSPPCPSTRQRWRSIPAMRRGKCIVLHHEAEEDTCRHRSLEGACSRGWKQAEWQGHRSLPHLCHHGQTSRKPALPLNRNLEEQENGYVLRYLSNKVPASARLLSRFL